MWVRESLEGLRQECSRERSKYYPHIIFCIVLTQPNTSTKAESREVLQFGKGGNGFTIGGELGTEPAVGVETLCVRIERWLAGMVH